MIVSDVHSPAPEAFEALRCLRALDYTTTAILMTAFGHDETRVQARACGASPLRLKPFVRGELDAAIATAVG